MLKTEGVGLQMSIQTWLNFDKEDFEDLRLGVVMNGGVSLAVWIGGVAMEMNRLTRSSAGDGSTYGDLLDIIKSSCRVDVIAGTSAGGINGGFLALAAAYGTELGGLGNLWADKGGLMELLRSPIQGQPPSLLKGDAYFLPELGHAFQSILPAVPNPQPKPPAEVPLDLTITTSVMKGMVREFTDSFGQQITETEHRGRFHFSRDERTDPTKDVFADPQIAEKLALAARSTASFPFAFEASYVPVGEDGPDPLHPRMDGIPNFGASRYVVDGGVLVNQPIGPALEAMVKQAGDRQVRRVLAYVNPVPTILPQLPGELFKDSPALSTVLMDSLVNLPSAQTIGQDLSDLREHNRRARDQRDLQPDLIGDLTDAAQALAPDLFATYQRVRRRRALTKIAESVEQKAPAPKGTAGAWTVEEIVEAFEAEPPVPLKFIPAEMRIPGGIDWDWGLAPLERLCLFGREVLRRALLITPFEMAETRTNLRAKRSELWGLLSTLNSLRQADAAFWSAAGQAPPPPPKDPSARSATLRSWAEKVRENWPPAHSPESEGFSISELGYLGDFMARVLIEALPVVREATAASIDPEEGRDLEALVNSLTKPLSSRPGTAASETPPSDDNLAVRNLLGHVLALEVTYVALTASQPTLEQEIDLVQVSADTPNTFQGPTKASAKLAGVQLGHFGAFYKKSWRVNDWIWGRLDGATRLAEVALGPARLRQLGLGVEDAVALIRHAAGAGPAVTGPDLPPAPSTAASGAPDYLTKRFDDEEQSIRAELNFLSNKQLPLPLKLPVAAGAIARRVQAQILAEELEKLALAIDDDLEAGSGRRRSASSFAARYKAEKANYPEGIPSRKLFALFRDSRVGEERLTEEIGTDLFASTTSRALAVSTSALDIPKMRLGPARAILRSVRGVALMLYSLIYGAAIRGRFSSWAVNAVLATGGALLAISLTTPKQPAIVKALAALIVVAGLAMAALRSKLWTFAVALAVPLLTAVTFIVALGAWQKVERNAGVILLVFGLVLATALLGSIRQPAGTPPLTNFKSGKLQGAVFLVSAAAAVGAFLLGRRWLFPDNRGLQFAFTVRNARKALATGAFQIDSAFWASLVFLAVCWVPLAILIRWSLDRMAPKGKRLAIATGLNFAWLALFSSLIGLAVAGLMYVERRQLGAAHPSQAVRALTPVVAVLGGTRYLFLAAGIVFVILAAVGTLRSRSKDPSGAAPKPAAAGRGAGTG
jgi:patatin-related protein